MRKVYAAKTKTLRIFLLFGELVLICFALYRQRQRKVDSSFPSSRGTFEVVGNIASDAAYDTCGGIFSSIVDQPALASVIALDANKQ